MEALEKTMPSIIEVKRRVIHGLQIDRLRKDEIDKTSGRMEVFTGPKTPVVRARPPPLRKYQDLKALNTEQQRRITSIKNIVAALE